MATNTYVEIGKVTTTGSVSSVEFTGISSGYTDLRIVNNVIGVGTGSVLMQFNNDTSTNYSITRVGGNGSTATSNRVTSQTSLSLSWSAAYTSSGRLTQIADIMNYSNTTTFKNVVCRSGKADNAVDLIAGLWRSTSAITSIKLLAETSNFASGSTFSLYGIRAEGVSPTTKATGGAVYSDSTYYYHVFGASGTFTPTQSITADILVVAGGGGAKTNSSGGGGAGGLYYYAGVNMTATGYTCTVGAGGAGLTDAAVVNNKGSNSQFGGYSAISGGGGATGRNYSSPTYLDGGSGAGATSGGGYAATYGVGTSGQGNNGGTATNSAPEYGGGGGGGAGGVGANGTSTVPGVGGVGSSTYSSWGVATGVGQNVSGTYYLAGGGGGGGQNIASVGGYGGGGNGGTTNNSGMANTGGGGGAGYGAAAGGNGGSGVVIVRYAK